MQKPDARPNNNGFTVLWLLITGAGIGWLLGLSVSPVVSIVITSVTGAAAAIVAALSGLEDQANESDAADKGHSAIYRWKIDPLPLAMLTLGILGGSIVGIGARNYSWLGSEATGEVTQWTKAGLTGPGWTREEIARKLFESRYSSHNTITNTVAIPAAKDSSNFGTVLFAANTKECTRLLAAAKLSEKIAGDTSLQEALVSSPIDQLARLPMVITDTTILKNVVEQVLCADAR